MFGKTLAALAALSLTAAPAAAQSAMADVRSNAPIDNVEEAAGGGALAGLLAFLAALGIIVVVVTSSDDDDVSAPVSP